MTYNPNRVTKYIPYEAELNMEGIEYPVKIKDIDRFEKQNNNISVNVLGYDEKKVFPLRISEEKERQHQVNLLLITDNSNTHYVLIKDMSRLLSAQYSKHNGNLYFCNYCFHGCRSEEVYKKHVEICKRHGEQRIKMPKKSDGKGRDKVFFVVFLVSLYALFNL